MLKKLSDFIYKITGVFISVDLAVIVVLSFSQVVSRYVFSFSISWAQELVTYLLVWLVFMGCGGRAHHCGGKAFTKHEIDGKDPGAGAADHVLCGGLLGEPGDHCKYVE